MNDVYRTIENRSEGTYREKGSRFLGFAYPVRSEKDIGEILSGLKKKMHDARHHCYAWRLGADLTSFRYNDGGEPSGSAGPPIYGQIQSRELTEVLVVVVRYFGGTLLGVGGLVHAYRAAASDALDHSRIIEKKVTVDIGVEFSYAATDLVMRIVKQSGLEVLEQRFDNTCSLALSVWIRNVEGIRRKLELIEGCRITWQR
ncbi:MAG: YigZ family protein [Bacteroidetes bacterium]|nr:MAG: YigZ family protein [Bacteroidota bacterium]